MTKKKYDLTSDIVNTDLIEADKTELLKKSVKTVLLTMSVNEDVRREFKTWCAQNGFKMNEAFLKGFELLKNNTNQSNKNRNT